MFKYIACSTLYSILKQKECQIGFIYRHTIEKSTSLLQEPHSHVKPCHEALSEQFFLLMIKPAEVWKSVLIELAECC